MRPRSMTGFGRGESQDQGQTWTVEIRTVNHRFLDQRIILPRQYQGLEDRVRKLVAARLDRGRVEVGIGLRGDRSGAVRLRLNLGLAEQYHGCLRLLCEELGLPFHIGLTEMLTLRDLIEQEEQSPDLDREWEALEQAVVGALDECDRMREREGARLKEELAGRLDTFAALVERIAAQVPEILAHRQQELQTRIERLLGDVDLDPVRLAQESALLADKADVTEEIVRLRSHIEQFTRFLAAGEPVGRRLDFLLQEFLREVNTLASKIANSTVAHLAVEMKNEIEKLREQVQNIE